MSDQANVPEEGVTEDFSSDLEAGFADDTGFELTETPSEDSTEVVQANAPEQQPEETLPWYARVTEEQFNELMNKANSVEALQVEHRRAMDQVFGRIGSMKQMLEQRQAETAEGAPVEFSAEDFAELANDFPELAETLSRSMTNAARKLRGTGVSVSQEPIDLNPIKQELRTQLSEEMLEDEHEGWKDFVQTPEFRTWLQTKPEDFQQKLIVSQNARFVSKSLNECKSWIAEQQAAQRKAQEKAQKQSARFAAAVNPKSSSSTSGSSSKTELDYLDEGFNS